MCFRVKVDVMLEVAPECRPVRRWLALDVGGDGTGEKTSAVEAHVGNCPACQEHGRQLQSAYQALQQVCAGKLLSLEEADSLVGTVQWRCHVYERDVPDRAWSAWLPVGAVAAACLAIVVLAGPSQHVPNLSHSMGYDRHWQPSTAQWGLMPVEWPQRSGKVSAWEKSSTYRGRLFLNFEESGRGVPDEFARTLRADFEDQRGL